MGRKPWCIALAVVMTVTMLGGPSIAAPKKGGGGAPAPSGPIVLTPPYPLRNNSYGCSRRPVLQLWEICSPGAATWPQTGLAESGVRVTSPQGGKYPQASAQRGVAEGLVGTSTNFRAEAPATQVHVTFQVEAEAAYQGATASISAGAKAAGELVVWIPGHVETHEPLIDLDPATTQPETFTGDVVVTSDLSSIPAGDLEVWAGPSTEANLPASNTGEVNIDVHTIVKSITIGGPAPSPTPQPTDPTVPTQSVVLAAPYDTVTSQNFGNDLTSDTNSTEGGAVGDAATGAAELHLATSPTRGLRTGMHIGSVKFAANPRVQSSCGIDVRAVWNIESIESSILDPNAYGQWSSVLSRINLYVADPSHTFTGFDEETVLDSNNATATIEGETVELSVRVPELSGDLLIESWVDGMARAEKMRTTLDAKVELESLTVAYC